MASVNDENYLSLVIRYYISPWARPRKFRNHYQIGGQRM